MSCKGIDFSEAIEGAICLGEAGNNVKQARMRTILIFQLVFGVFVPIVALCFQPRIDAAGLFVAPSFAEKWRNEQMQEKDIRILRESFGKLYAFNQTTKALVVADTNLLNTIRRVVFGILITNIAFALMIFYKTEKERMVARRRGVDAAGAGCLAGRE